MTRKMFFAVLTAAALLMAASAATASMSKVRRHGRAVDGQYMLLFQSDVSLSEYDAFVRTLATRHEFTVKTEWRSEPRGVVVQGLASHEVTRLASDPRVRLIEQDYHISAVEPSGVRYTGWDGFYQWALDRLDETNYWVHDGTYEMCPDGRAIYAYVLDRGVRGTHEQFTLNERTSRVVYSRAFDTASAEGYLDETNGCSPNSQLWHGTAVASLIAGVGTGSARANVVSLRIFDCFGNGFASYVINAVRWIRSTQDPLRVIPAW